MPSQHAPVVASSDELQATANQLAESILKRALAQLICEAIEKDADEEAKTGTQPNQPEDDAQLKATARNLVTEVMREAWKSFLDDCDLQEWLDEDPKENRTRQMADDLLKKAKEPNASGKTGRPGTSQPDVEKFFQSPGQRTNASSTTPGRTSGKRSAPQTGDEISFRYDGAECRVDLHAIRPFLPALSKVTARDAEGGEIGILLVDSSALPTRSMPDYDYIMQQIFLITIHWVEEYMCSNYCVVYLHGNSSKDHSPRAKWLKQWCQALTTKTTKHLSHLYVVFPTLWIRTLRIISRPFVKIKASVHFVSSVRSLLNQLPESEGILPKSLIESNSNS